MGDIIKLLPDHLANQIAAGEVVQRPANVVKELLENSVDALSTKIQLVVKDGGNQLIQVIDNGKGMSHTDARMCFERHATSKISKAEDLFCIRTMGFRGEAMASIAAVAQVELRTSTDSEALGTLIRIEGSEIKAHEPIQTSRGSNIQIKNLFYNLPARRNFLKTNTVEFSHIIEEFIKVALANPEIHFCLSNNGQIIYELSSGKLSNRIVDIFGKNYRENIIPCKEEIVLAKVTGYVGKPDIAKKKGRETYFFVNDRFFKSYYLNHAVKTAFDKLLPEDNNPFICLFIQIDPEHVDVNIHPTKTEIKFDDENSIYGLVHAAVKKAIGTTLVATALDFDSDVNLVPFSNFFNNTSSAFNNGSSGSEPRNYSSGSGYVKSNESDNLRGWKNLYNPSFDKNDEIEITPLNGNEEQQQTTLTFGSSINRDEVNVAEKYSDPKVIFQIHNTYILTQIKSGMMLIDQQAAHQRILFEKYSHHLQTQKSNSQQCLFPIRLTLSPSDYLVVSEIEPDLLSLGFSLSFLGTDTISINGTPVDMLQGSEKEIFEGIIEQFKVNKHELSLGTHESLAKSIASRSCIKKNQRLSMEEMHSIINQLFACKEPAYSPYNVKTFTIVDHLKLAELFK